MVTLETAEIDPAKKVVRLKAYEDLLWLAEFYKVPIFHDDRGPSEVLEEWMLVLPSGLVVWYGKA